MFNPPRAALAAAISLSVLSAAPGASTVPAASSVVVTGPARSLGEPAAAQDSSVTAVAATGFGADGARATVWTRRANSRTWRPAGEIMPDGFTQSYDPSAAALPGGPLLLVAGAAPAGSCIAGGSVGIADVSPDGHVSGTRLVSDQRGTGAFDDRPAVAAAGGLVWVAWSQGQNADSCQNVGQDDRLTVTTSRDGGATFGAPVTMPAVGGHAAFGARLAPLPGGRVAVSWTETMPGGDEAVLVSVLGPGNQVSEPQIVLRGAAPPLVLPGASFYDFPAGTLTALSDGTLVVAAPLWNGGHSVVEVAAGPPGGPWQTGTIRPPSGADLLLPAVGALGTSGALLLCAVHYRAADRLGYAAARLAAAAWSPSLTAVTSALEGPGFYEIGEEASLTPAPAGLIAPVVVAGRDGATLQTLSWAAPPKPVPSPSPAPSATRHPSRKGTAIGTGGTGGEPPRWLLPTGLAAAAILAAVIWAAVRPARRRRSRPKRPRRT